MKIKLEDLDPCAKQNTLAIVEKNGKYWIGTNSCIRPQATCPRGNMPSGVGYEFCNDICQQTGHAEVNAIKAAGKKNAKDSNLYLFGHYRICDDCASLTKEYKVKKVFIVNEEAIQPHFQ